MIGRQFSARCPADSFQSGPGLRPDVGDRRQVCRFVRKCGLGSIALLPEHLTGPVGLVVLFLRQTACFIGE